MLSMVVAAGIPALQGGEDVNWRAINTDIDTYEQIFDLESFRPV